MNIVHSLFLNQVIQKHLENGLAWSPVEQSFMKIYDHHHEHVSNFLFYSITEVFLFFPPNSFFCGETERQKTIKKSCNLIISGFFLIIIKSGPPAIFFYFWKIRILFLKVTAGRLLSMYVWGTTLTLYTCTYLLSAAMHKLYHKLMHIVHASRPALHLIFYSFLLFFSLSTRARA